MNNSLYISEVLVSQMGGLNSKNLEFSSSGLTVIYGENEKGKSTTADLLVYLLAQTGLDGELFRFGKHEQYISGEIRGVLEGERFEIRRQIKISKHGSPSGEVHDINLSGTSIDAEKWKRRLNLTKDSFERIYRLRGESLFSEKVQSLDLIEKLATGNDEFDASIAKTGFEDTRKKALKNKRTDGDFNYRDLIKQQEKIESDLDNIKTNRSRCEALDQEIDIAESQVQKFGKEIKDLSEDIQTVEQLIEREADTINALATLEDEMTDRSDSESDERQNNDRLKQRATELGILLHEISSEFRENIATIAGLATHWEIAENELTDSKTNLSEAENKLKESEDKLTAHEESWKDLCPKIDYEDWMEEYHERILAGSNDEEMQEKPLTHLRVKVLTWCLSAVAVASALFLNSPVNYVVSVVLMGVAGTLSLLNRSSKITPSLIPEPIDDARTPNHIINELYGNIKDAKTEFKMATSTKERNERNCESKREKLDEKKGLVQEKTAEFGIEIPETATVIEVQQVFNIAEELMKSNLHLKAFSKQSKQDQKTKEKLHREIHDLKEQKEKILEEANWSGTLKDLKREKERKKEKLEDDRDDKLTELGALGEERQQYRKSEEWHILSDQYHDLEEKKKQRVIEGAANYVAEFLVSKVQEDFINIHLGPLLTEANKYFEAFTKSGRQIVRGPESGSVLKIKASNGVLLELEQLSTGARCALYLALRLAKADLDIKENETVSLPFVCDDPFVHVDDARMKQILLALYESMDIDRQIILFTCHERVRNEAASLGANVIEM